MSILGYSNNQSAYLCYDYVFGKLYVSRHVLFIEDRFQGSSKFTVVSNPSRYMLYNSDSISMDSSNLVVPKDPDHVVDESQIIFAIPYSPSSLSRQLYV